MSIVIPQLSFIETFTNYTTTVVNCEGYTSFNFFVYPGTSGTLDISYSVDGETFELYETYSLTGFTVSTQKLQMKTKFMRYVFTMGASSEVVCQTFFFEDDIVGFLTSSASLAAGTGIALNTVAGVTTISNTAPDKIVALSSANSGLVISGTYPNFLLDNQGILALAVTAPLVSSGTQSPTLSIPPATTSADGYLTSTDWNTFNGKQPAGTYVTSVGGTAPVVSSGGTTPTIAIPVATTSADGYLTSTDWNTFNNKGSGTVTSVGATAPVTSTGGATPTIAIPVATTSADGYLTSTDWNTFNGKQPAGTYVTSVGGTAPVVSSGGTTPAISMAAASTLVDGYLTSTDWNTFNSKGSGTVTSVSGTAPVVSSGGATPAISMAAATTSTNGYLTSTDWNTFNNKGSGTVTSVGGTAPVVSSGGATPTISMAAATSLVSGYLVNADWSNFNSKQAALSSVGGQTLLKSAAVLYSLIAGTGITFSVGTDSITINSAMATPSYFAFSYSNASYGYTASTNTKITSGITTVAISSDWTNNGSGLFTYSGVPRMFWVTVRTKQTSATNSFTARIRLYKNDVTSWGLFNKPSDTWIGALQSSGSGSTTAQDFEQTVGGPCAIATGDTFYMYVEQNAANTGTSTNFAVNIEIVGDS